MFYFPELLRRTRLIELAEGGRDLLVTCPECERSDVWDRGVFAARFRSALGATVGQLEARTTCATCGGKVKFSAVLAVDFEELRVSSPDHQQAKARYITKVRAELGLPAASHRGAT